MRVGVDIDMLESICPSVCSVFTIIHRSRCDDESPVTKTARLLPYVQKSLAYSCYYSCCTSYRLINPFASHANEILLVYLIIHMYADDYLIPDADKFGNDPLALSWRHHLGGVEGLRQKGWTIVTSAALTYCARQNGLKADILGSGDNQVLVLEIPLRYGDSEDPYIQERSRDEARLRF
ncbi:hypothetical protein COOONC_10033 [Cooperia oncophora]